MELDEKLVNHLAAIGKQVIPVEPNGHGTVQAFSDALFMGGLSQLFDDRMSMAARELCTAPALYGLPRKCGEDIDRYVLNHDYVSDVGDKIVPAPVNRTAVKCISYTWLTRKGESRHWY